MPITSFLRRQVFDPEMVELMTSAYEQACTTLGLADCNDPLNEIIAERVIKLVQQGVRTRTALYILAVQDFKGNPQ